MHETSLVAALLRQVDRVCAEHGGPVATEVRVEVGQLSGVEPLLVASAFERLKKGTSAARAQLAIDSVPLEAVCLACGRESEVRDFHFRCPHCHHDRLRIVRGEAFQLVSVSVDSGDDPGKDTEAATVVP
jgi:hydrogenase nickel incorporation protein HypA/HybF